MREIGEVRNDTPLKTMSSNHVLERSEGEAQEK